MTDPRDDEDWRALDEARDPVALLSFLDAFAELPEVAAAKNRSLELLGARPGHRVLDAGCGSGGDAVVLAERVLPGGEVIGVDTSEIAIAAAEKRARGHAGLSFLQADVGALPFPDSHFDSAHTDRVLQHVAEPEVAVGELLRVTRPGGVVVISQATFKRPHTRAAGRRRSSRALLPFLPLLLRRAGAVDVRIESSQSVIHPGRAVLDVLKLEPGPIEVRVTHVLSRLPP